VRAVNRVLNTLGLNVSRAHASLPPAFLRRYREQLSTLRASESRGFGIVEEIYYEAGRHPQTHVDYECQFVAEHLARLSPAIVLDVGSYRQFVIGLLAHYQVTTVDVRPRHSIVRNETVLVADAKSLQVPDNHFDAVVSLCAIEHFGLGRYGDEFDLSGDLKAFSEMIRVLKPGGHVIFSTTITNAMPVIAFNGHRIYSQDMLRRLCARLELVEERFVNPDLAGFCTVEEITRTPNRWNVYVACWRKPQCA
jgi:SAM-dependent methyltransferase